MRRLADPLLWLVLFYLSLLAAMPYSGPVFAAWFPDLARPLYQQDSFWQLTLAHLFLVVTASLMAVVIGVGSGVLVTRPAGRAFRPLLETIAAAGQTIPPVAGAGDSRACHGIRRVACRGGIAALWAAADFTGHTGGAGQRPGQQSRDRRGCRHEWLAAFVAG